TALIELSAIGEDEHTLSIHFRYGPYVFKSVAERPVSVKMEHVSKTDSYTFYRVKRSIQWEEKRTQELEELGLNKKLGQGHTLVDWLNEHEKELVSRGFEIIQREGEKKYVFGRMELDFEIKEENDWFD